MDQAPDPTDRRTDEALLKIAPDQLREQAALFHQIAKK
jgi:hypothetical protein